MPAKLRRSGPLAGAAVLDDLPNMLLGLLGPMRCKMRRLIAPLRLARFPQPAFGGFLVQPDYSGFWFSAGTRVQADMNRPLTATAAMFVLMLRSAGGTSLLSDQQARAKAVEILKGDPYGRTAAADVAKNIKEVQLVPDGNTKACGVRKGPVWEFHIVAVTANKDQFNKGVIDGYLALGAHNGKILYANLPLLD
jgi:hypothetical protein